MSVTCLADQSVHPDRDALHKHLRKLRLKQEEYYNLHEPRLDRCTGEPIPYKAPTERYLKTEFATKHTLKRWIRSDVPEAREWALNWLRKRREEKGLVYPPSQVELRSLMCPTIPYYDFIGGYNTICAEMGYTIRYDETLDETSLPANAVIIEDTREQQPLIVPFKTVQQKLNCGDYALAPPHDRGVYIERKSLPDFVSTASERKIERKSGDDSNLDRFTRELERAEEEGRYVIMLVEADINDALGFNFLPQFTRRFGQRFDVKTRRMVPCEYRGAMPDHIFKNLRDLIVRFPGFQVLFVKSRDEAANAVVKLLAAGESVKRVDLQLEYESKRLTF